MSASFGEHRDPLVGIFVGGQSQRMGGLPKGLLAAPDTGEGLVERLTRLCNETWPNAPIVLVGAADPYRKLGLGVIVDDPSGIGPMGGLRAVLFAARGLDRPAIALACDLPHVTAELLARLDSHAPRAAAVAPRQKGLWQPLFARYSPARTLPAIDRALASQRHSLQAVLELLGSEAAVLPLSTAQLELLEDWDVPPDVPNRID